MYKKITSLLLCFLFFTIPAYADNEATFKGSVKNGKDIEVTISASEGVYARAFVYTYTVSGGGHCLLNEVDVTDIASGESKKLVITPPEEGFKKKLVVAERFTLKPLCQSFEYPYIVNVYAEPLGYKLTDVGTITEGGKTYASNTFDITGFVQGEPVVEASILSLMLAARK